VTEQLVTIGREDEAYGLPLVPKPVILVRSGLTSGDLESVYGAFIWFKQFVRMEPYRCPYAHQLASQFRLAWIPCLAPWELREGWRRSDRLAHAPMTIETDGNTVATLIDIVSRPINRARVVFPKNDAFAHYATWLPRLAAAFPPGSPFAPRVGDDDSFLDRDRFSWARAPYHVQLAAVPEAFETGAPRDVLAAGGQAIRIEIPAHDADFTAYSIESTDLAATLLEHVIGLQYGLIAVNRQPAATHFDALPPVAPGEAVIIDRRDPVLRENASQVG
jgi:hypothetical protein